MNVSILDIQRNEFGREFHRNGAIWVKALSPYAFVLPLLATRRFWDAERKDFDGTYCKTRSEREEFFSRWLWTTVKGWSGWTAQPSPPSISVTLPDIMKNRNEQNCVHDLDEHKVWKVMNKCIAFIKLSNNNRSITLITLFLHCCRFWGEPGTFFKEGVLFSRWLWTTVKGCVWLRRHSLLRLRSVLPFLILWEKTEHEQNSCAWFRWAQSVESNEQMYSFIKLLTTINLLL